MPPLPSPIVLPGPRVKRSRASEADRALHTIWREHMDTSRRGDRQRWADRGRLLISCPDRPGIIAAVSRFLAEHRANIVDSDQHSTGSKANLFFMRVEFDVHELAAHLLELEVDFGEIALRFAMELRMALAS